MHTMVLAGVGSGALASLLGGTSKHHDCLGKGA